MKSDNSSKLGKAIFVGLILGLGVFVLAGIFGYWLHFQRVAIWDAGLCLAVTCVIALCARSLCREGQTPSAS